MRSCYCTLPYVNPRACDNCPNNDSKVGYDKYVWVEVKPEVISWHPCVKGLRTACEICLSRNVCDVGGNIK